MIIGVDDLDAYVAKVTAAGCEIVTPRTPIPGVGHFANFRDTEGNVVGMFMDDNAALIEITPREHSNENLPPKQ